MVALSLLLLLYKDHSGGAEEARPPTATVDNISSVKYGGHSLMDILTFGDGRAEPVHRV